jgi:hypothetical protein
MNLKTSFFINNLFFPEFFKDFRGGGKVFKEEILI